MNSFERKFVGPPDRGLSANEDAWVRCPESKGRGIEIFFPGRAFIPNARFPETSLGGLGELGGFQHTGKHEVLLQGFVDSGDPEGDRFSR